MSKYKFYSRWNSSVVVFEGDNLTNADLTDADLTDANLTNADLTRANLTGANLTNANLTRADLTYADLTDANLTNANLADADLTGADLTCANLTCANLTRANLTRADLTRANLTRADLTCANLTRANLADVTIWASIGNSKQIKTILISDIYPIVYTKAYLQIGCKRHTFDEWQNFTTKDIFAMDGQKAIDFWENNKDFIFLIIDKYPAV